MMMPMSGGVEHHDVPDCAKAVNMPNDPEDMKDGGMDESKEQM